MGIILFNQDTMLSIIVTLQVGFRPLMGIILFNWIARTNLLRSRIGRRVSVP